MSIEDRMKTVLQEDKGVLSKDMYLKASQVLALGLRDQLPEDSDDALDYLIELMKRIVRQRYYVKLALRYMGFRNRRQSLARKIMLQR